MRIITKSTQLEITSPLEAYIQKRFSALEKFIHSFEESGDNILYIEVARTTQHHNKGEKVYYVECTIEIYSKIVRIEQYSDDVRRAIDQACTRLKRELRQLKESIQDKHQEEGREKKFDIWLCFFQNYLAPLPHTQKR